MKTRPLRHLATGLFALVRVALKTATSKACEMSTDMLSAAYSRVYELRFLSFDAAQLCHRYMPMLECNLYQS